MMDILGLIGSVTKVVTGPVGIIGSIVGGGIFAKLWSTIKQRKNPLDALDYMVGLIEKAVLHADDKFIDKFLPKPLKKVVQKDLRDKLIQSSNRLIALSEKISD